MSDLSTRRILLLSPVFFGYEQRMADHFRSRGASVDWIDDRASNHSLFKISVRLNLPGSGLAARRHFRRAFQGLEEGGYTDVVLVNPESCGLPMVRRLRQLLPRARFALYMWDSFENRQYLSPEALLSQFDKTLTFDDDDAKRYGMHFRPLFFCEAPPPQPVTPRFAFSFIGTMHTDRYRILRALERQVSAYGLASFTYPYLPSRVLYWSYRATRPEYRSTRPGDFKYTPLRYEQALEITSASMAAVDIEHPRQRGLTIRTFEVLAAGKKLLTTNARVRGYDFYSTERIAVLDRRAPRVDRAFFEEPPPPLDPRQQARYSIRAWADEVLG